MSLRAQAALVALVAALPRVAVLLYERGDILGDFVEKSDDFARTFVASGTFGFVPGEPSAYTQPLYSFLLIPLYEVAGRSWWTVGALHLALAVATALLVWEIGRRCLGERAGLVAALVTTLSPYLVWHDVHVNREIADQPLAAALVLLALVAAAHRSVALAGALGAVYGLAALGNSRLAALPLVLVPFLVWRIGPSRRAVAASAALLAAGGLVVAPWVVRNRVELGCATITSDARALWKANNEHTYDVLASGRWIDEVPDIPGAPVSPQTAGGIYESSGRVVRVDECAQMRFYQERVREFWREQPGEKARLAVQAAGMLWDPRTTLTEGRPEAGSFVDTARSWVQPLYTLPLYVLAAAGIALVPRALAVLAAGLLAYGTLTAMAFAGATRYRAPWDFLLALLAAAALVRLAELARARAGRARPSAPRTAAR